MAALGATACAAALALCGLARPALAREASVCEPPRCQEQELEFGGARFEQYVLLPRGYWRSSARYPVLYLLHTGFENRDEWLVQSEVEELISMLPLIVVLPSNHPFGSTTNWGADRFEDLWRRALIPLTETCYRARRGRAYRAIAGASAGAFGALHLASRHPDLFAAVGGFSADFYDLTELSPAKEAAVLAQFGPYNAICSQTRGQDPLELCRGHYSDELTQPFGDPITNEVAYHNHSPTDLAQNLGGDAVYIASGNGTPCDGRDVRVLAENAYNPFIHYEPLSLRETELMDEALARARVVHRSDLYGCGIHDFVTYRYFMRDLRAFLPQMRAAFGGPPPAAFDYRAADAAFEVWGWRFEADPRRASEFLDVTAASRRGVTLSGSGIEAVRSAPYFGPTERIRLRGALERAVRSDRDGRISFHVDLGPPHPNQQYTLEARLAGQDEPGYFGTARVRFAR